MPYEDTLRAIIQSIKYRMARPQNALARKWLAHDLATHEARLAHWNLTGESQ